MWSDVLPGNYHTVHGLLPAVEAAEIALDLAPYQRERTVWRLDGGSGSEEKLRQMVQRGYHILAKGLNNHRAVSLARQVSRWDAFEDGWVAEVSAPQDYARPVRVFVRRWLRDATLHYCYYVTTLSLPSKSAFLALYNARGAAEVEQFRSDKSGLSLAVRRKHSYPAQVAYVLLTDLAHNLLADLYHQVLHDSKFESFGLKRIVRDLLAVPGRLCFENGRLQKIELLSQKQNAKELLNCLKRYCSE